MGLEHREFMALFDEWAPTYDDTVLAETPADGFERYAEVLERVARLAGVRPGRRIADVGAGTGNLSQVLLRHGAAVTAVEPSAGMRRLAAEKLGAAAPVLDGHFLRLPLPDGSQDAVVSTYAFHHLTDEQKAEGAREMLRALRPGGRIVLGDIAWASEQARQAMLERFRRAGRRDLVQEMEEEYYPTIGVLTQVFAELGCPVCARQMTEWVWIVTVRKPRA